MKLQIICLYFDKKLIATNHRNFLNIQCGRRNSQIHLEMESDDSGVNISERNAYWSEITGLYWYWKNNEIPDVVGLVSYRRFFNFNLKTPKPVQLVNIEDGQEVFYKCVDKYNNILSDCDILTPIPYTYAKSIEEVCYKNYKKKDFDILKEAIISISPDYYPTYLSHMQGNKMIGHNMFVTRKDIFEKYCEWVFEILFYVEKRIDPKNYPVSQIRVFGYMHEILLEVFIKKNNLISKRSQISWVNEDLKSVRFNKFYYRLAANLIYQIR